MKNKIIQAAKVVISTGAFFGFVAVAGAVGTWTPPPAGATPSTYNVGEPVNITATAQTKAGLLAVTGFSNWGTSYFDKYVDIGSIMPGGTAANHKFWVGNGDSWFGGNLKVTGSGSSIFVGDGILSVNGTPPSRGKILVNGLEVCIHDGTACGSTGGVTGSGTANRLAKFTGTGSGLGDSSIIDTGTAVKFLPKALTITSDQGGSMELGGTNGDANSGYPYLDFHGANSSPQDYNARIINDGNNKLSFATAFAGTVMSIDTNVVKVNGGLTVNGVNVCLQNGTNCPSISTPPPAPTVETHGTQLYQIYQDSSGGSPGGCNAIGNAPNDGAMLFLGAGTMQRGTVTTYKYCKISGAFYNNIPIGWAAP